ncbi:putative Amine oxidase [Seiridium unicorne]|uniref:Amine oxidase n=1 Tax=Seiridium unicorne TaxID=138068 RepID=A0ABR2V7M4_9PEZI
MSLNWLLYRLIAFSSCLSVGAPSPACQTRDTTSCRKTQVAILGAGVTGITAAQALSNASTTDFLIIERNDYIGGRVAHTTFGTSGDGSPYTIELGANWIQGLGADGPENPIWTFGKKYQLNNTYSNYSSILTYDATGYNDFSALLDTWDTMYEDAEDDAGTILTDNLQDTDARTGFRLRDWKPKKDMQAQAVEWWSWDWETSYPPEESSFAFGIAGSNVTFNQFGDANNFVTDQRGFNAFIIGEANEFLVQNDSRLLLNTVVTGITYSGDGVIVDLDDGGCIEASHAVCTFSLGVLQNDVVNFEPPLPRWKREAIEMFEMGTYTKIFLQFDETFWDPDTQFFLYADPDTRGYYPVWQSLSTPGFLEGSNIIFVTLVGPESYRVEQQSDEQTKTECLAVLGTMFPDIEIPEPIAFHYPRWSQEEWAFGSYSNWPVGMTLEKHQNLRANLDRLWFAGEANSAEYYGFLQGGWFEGQDVGLRIAALLSTNHSSGNGTRPLGPMARYEVLHGTTDITEYNVTNGWTTSSFLIYESDD